MSQALIPCLETAVMLRIMEIRQMGYIPDYLYEEARKTGDLIANCGDRLLFRSTKLGETAQLFNQAALAIAVLAFQPGGVEIFGFKFEASFPKHMINIKSLRELDKLVAEKIFGWCDFWESSATSTGWYYLKGCPPQEQAIGVDAKRQEAPVPKYSTDVAAAWSITEKFYSANISKLSNGTEYSAYLVTTDGEANVDGLATAKTVEIALCLAALKTKNIEVVLSDA
ncbi:MAG: BC1872 family protein [Nostoc sp. ChiSLP01]|nr:hypothetical protein [Nostoc sp. CmiSLP01]MDZ8285216.1 hypothetical protein [Nostoc sp. ChiSLP01]